MQLGSGELVVHMLYDVPPVSEVQTTFGHEEQQK